MNDRIPPTPQALNEALELSTEILKNIELKEAPLGTIALKASRLARLLNDFDYQKAMEYEAGGYPSSATGFPQDVWRLVCLAGRSFQQKDAETHEVKTFGYGESIEQLEEQIESAKLGIRAARDRDVSISSANPRQTVFTPIGNISERTILRTQITTAVSHLSSRRTFIHNYAVQRHHELKFSGIAEDAFSRIRESVGTKVGMAIPNALQRFAAIHDNLQSDNPANWSNAVHGCRRIIEDLADVVFPAQAEDRIVHMHGKQRSVKLGKGNYKNRIICFVEDNSDSMRYQEIVGSNLEYLINRLDSVCEAAQKGTHGTIVTREEADRYVVYTYMLVSDILALWNP